MKVPELRFKDENGNEFPEWEAKKLGDFFVERTERNKDSTNTNLLSVTIGNGVIEQSTGVDYDCCDLVL